MNTECLSTNRHTFWVLLIIISLLCAFPCSSLAQPLTEAEQSWLADKKEITFVSQSAYPPFEFIDANQSRTGMCIELVRWIATEYGFKAKFLDMTFQEAQQEVLSGEADVITSLFYSKKRDQKFDFTIKTWDVPALIFVRVERPDISTINNLQKKRIAMQRGDYAKEFLDSKGIDYEILPTESFSAAIDKVVSGAADAVIGDKQIVLYHLFSNNLCKQIKSVGEPLYCGRNCMGVRKGAIQLQSILNKGIELAYERRIFSSITRKWMGTLYNRNIPWYERHFTVILMALSGLMALFLAILLLNRRLRRTVLDKTLELNRKETLLRTLIETIPDMIWLKNSNGVYLLCNPRFEHFFGAREHKIVGKTDYDFVVKEVADSFCQNDRSAISAGKALINEEKVVYVDDGHTELLETIRIPMYDHERRLVGVLGIARDITERKQVEEQLRLNEERFRIIADFSYDWEEWHLPDGSYEYISPSCEFVTGYTQAEFIADPNLFAQIIHPDDSDIVAKHYQRHLQPGTDFDELTFRIITKTGDMRWIWHKCNPVVLSTGEWRGRRISNRDITEIKRLENILYDREMQFNEAQKIAQLGHWKLDNVTGSLNWSDQIYQIFELSPDEFVPTIENFMTRVHPDDRNFVQRSFVDHLKKCQPYDIQHRILIEGKPGKWVREVCHTDYCKNGEPLNTIGIVHDITSHRNNITKLKKAEAEANSANQTKSVFLSNISHELRTPLNAILGYAQIFSRDSSLTTRQQSGIKTIRQAGEHLLMLINDILDLTKIEAHKMELVFNQFRLPDFFQEVVQIVKPQAERKNLDFFYEPETELPEMIRADELRLRQVLLNLLANAIKFTQNGFFRLRVRSQALTNNRINLTIAVEDSGIGVAEPMIEKIFEPFQQIGDRLKYAEGSGLGLAISRQLVHLMGGELRFSSPHNLNPDSGEGPGSCVSFTIEVAVLGESAKSLPESCKVTGYNIPGKEYTPKKILIVDDISSNRLVLRDTLKPLGFVVNEAVDGSEALELCRRFRPDVILMDLLMPTMDGLSATKVLKGQPDFAHIPIIAITASTTDSEKQRQHCLKNGFSSYITKPYNMVLLLKTIADLLNLELTYDTQTSVAEEDNKIVAPPYRIIKPLEDLIQEGDIDTIAALTTEIMLLESGKYHAFAQRISMFADDFKLAEMEKFISLYK